VPDTARFIEVHLKRKKPKIIFTGSMIPLSAFSNFGAAFNQGYSPAKINHPRSGSYVCMNGRIFKPVEIQKLIWEGRFASIFQD